MSSHKLEKQSLNPDSVRRGYEVSDVQLYTLTQWAIGMGVFILIGAGLAGLSLWGFLPRQTQVNTPYPMSSNVGRPLPPEPRLQAHPKRDMVVFRQEEEEKLGKNGVVNGQSVISVQQAMDDVLNKGLPTRAVPSSDPSAFVEANRADASLPPSVGGEGATGKSPAYSEGHDETTGGSGPGHTDSGVPNHN